MLRTILKAVGKNLGKNLVAAALGGALVAGASAEIDPDHLGDSLKDLGKIAATGALVAVAGYNKRSPHEKQ